LIGALVFALTLVPALCAALFRPRHAKLEEPPWVERLRARYRRSLSWLLERRGKVLAAAFVLPALAVLTLTRLGTEFLPELDEGGARMAPGLRQKAPDRRNARLFDRNSRRALQLLATDEGQRRGSGQRRARQGGAEGFRSRSGANADYLGTGQGGAQGIAGHR